MPLTHTGAQSQVPYQIPALADVRDPSKAFADFADSIPASVKPVELTYVTASGPATANHLYVYDGAAGITMALPGSAKPGDKVIAYQVGAGGVTLAGVAVGPPITDKQYGAVTALWDGARWVAAPFSFSGTQPTQSTGGDVVDLNGFRYHIFRTPGTSTFVSHKAQDVEVLAVAGGGAGAGSSTTEPGNGGQGGAHSLETVSVAFWSFLPVKVGAGADGANPAQGSEFVSVNLAAGVNGVGGTPTPDSPALAITGDWATALGISSVGGNGAGSVGPVDGATPGAGGGGGYKLLAPYTQETETYSYTTGGPYTYNCSYPARAEPYQTGSITVVQDPCVGGQCPPGWRCEDRGLVAGNRCVTDVPQYETRYHCDSGGSLNGTTCSKTCSGDNTQHHTGTRAKACNSGYVAVSGTCVDSRSPGGGRGSDGLVAIRYRIS